MKKKHTVLAVLAVSLAALIGVSAWQQDNIRAFIYAMTASSGELLARQKESEAQLKAAIAKEGFKAPEIDGGKIAAALNENKSSREIAEQILREAKGGSQGALPDKTAESETGSPSAGSASAGTEESGAGQTEDGSDFGKETKSAEAGEAELENQINLRIAQLYVIEAAYNQKIDAVIEKAKEEYYALPAGERTKAKKYDIIISKVHELTDLEIACDREVDAVVEELEGILKDAGKSTEICGQILEYYNNEKADRRAYFLAYIKERKQ